MNSDEPKKEKPWLRRKGETASAYRAFCIYLRLGPGRSVLSAYLEYTAAKAGPKKGQQTPGFFNKWSSRFNWTERVTEYDLQQAEESVERASLKIEYATELLIDIMIAALEFDPSELYHEDGTHKKPHEIAKKIRKKHLQNYRKKPGRNGEEITVDVISKEFALSNLLKLTGLINEKKQVEHSTKDGMPLGLLVEYVDTESEGD